MLRLCVCVCDGGDIRMQLTFFIGQEIKCPGWPIYLNHGSSVFFFVFFLQRLSKRELALMLLQPEPDERDGRARPFQIAGCSDPVWGVETQTGTERERVMQQTAVGEAFQALRSSFLVRLEYMDPDNIPDQSKVACVCPRITVLACLQGERLRTSLALNPGRNNKPLLKIKHY